MTNAKFAESSEMFRSACREVAKIPLFENIVPTKRQASKWRMRKGAAYDNARFIIRNQV